MENISRDIELVQRYFEKNISEAEKQELEYRLPEEPMLQNIFSEQRRLVLGIRYHHLEEKLAQLRNLEAVLPVQQTTPTGRMTKLWIPLSVAASLTLLVGVWFFFLRDTRPLNEQLFVSNFEAFDSPGSGLTRGDNNTGTSPKSLAYEAYDKGEYRKAIELFEDLATSNDPIIHLCLGNAYLAVNEAAEAERVFLHMTKEHEDLITQAKWYLALSYLKQNKLERTKATLWQISKSSMYGEKARKLLDDLGD